MVLWLVVLRLLVPRLVVVLLRLLESTSGMARRARGAERLRLGALGRGAGEVCS